MSEALSRAVLLVRRSLTARGDPVFLARDQRRSVGDTSLRWIIGGSSLGERGWLAVPAGSTPVEVLSAGAAEERAPAVQRSRRRPSLVSSPFSALSRVWPCEGASLRGSWGNPVLGTGLGQPGRKSWDRGSGYSVPALPKSRASGSCRSGPGPLPVKLAPGR